MDQLDDIEALIVGYLNGTISADERRRLTEWLDRSAHNRAEFDRIRELWLASELAGGKFHFDSQAAFARFRVAIAARDTGFSERRRQRLTLSYPWAAVLVITALAGGAILYGIIGPRWSDAFRVAYQEITVPNGSRSSVTLPDSSVMTINAGTTVRYRSDFGRGSRDIWLDGEAYFVVRRSPVPFIVHSGTVQIKAVGTEFNVRGYSTENKVETTLVSGKVLVTDTSGQSDMTGEVALLPNQKLIVSRVEAALLESDSGITEPDRPVASTKPMQTVIKEERIDPVPDISWKDAQWVIYRESLGDLSVKLERRYNVEIVFTDEHLKSFRYSGTLPDESLEQVLRLMSLVSPIRYTVRGKTVVFSENRLFKPR